MVALYDEGAHDEGENDRRCDYLDVFAELGLLLFGPLTRCHRILPCG